MFQETDCFIFCNHGEGIGRTFGGKEMVRF